MNQTEQEAMDLTVKLWGMLGRIVGSGPTREQDLRELAFYIHGIQHTVMAQAAARMYPTRYRLLGDVIPEGETGPRGTRHPDIYDTKEFKRIDP